jgi:hypothetical protein
MSVARQPVIALQTFLQDLVRASGVPQCDLAHRVGLTEKHVSEMMNGWSQGKLSAWQALLDAAGVALPAMVQVADETDRKYAFNSDEADDVWVDKP